MAMFRLILLPRNFNWKKAQKCAGNLDIGLGVFAGEYRGRMKAKSVWLLASSKLFGKIEYQALQMERGAALNCHILHNWTENEIETEEGKLIWIGMA